MAWEHIKHVEAPTLLLDLVKGKLENPYSIEYRVWAFNEKANMNRTENRLPRRIERRHLI